MLGSLRFQNIENFVSLTFSFVSMLDSIAVSKERRDVILHALCDSCNGPRMLWRN